MHPGAQRRHLVVKSENQPLPIISHRVVGKNTRTYLIHLNDFKFSTQLAK